MNALVLTNLEKMDAFLEQFIDFVNDEETAEMESIDEEAA